MPRQPGRPERIKASTLGVQRLKKERANRGWSQEKLAIQAGRFLDGGEHDALSPQTVSNAENSGKGVSSKSAIAICKALDIDDPWNIFPDLNLSNHTPVRHPLHLPNGVYAIPVEEMSLADLPLRLGPRSSATAAYFERDVFYEVCKILRKARDAADERFGVLVTGRPLIGKTRLVVEACRRELNDFLLVLWPSHVAQLPADQFRDTRIALVLDDLHERQHEHMDSRLLYALADLQGTRSQLVLLATCRNGTDLNRVKADLYGVVEQLTVVEIQPMRRFSQEDREFQQHMRSSGVPFDEAHYDGTPGSGLLGLGRRTAQLLNPAFDGTAAGMLRAMALLRRFDVNEPLSRTVAAVAEQVFGIQDLPAQQSRALEYLERNEWVRVRTSQVHGGESYLAIVEDGYLEVCVAEAFPSDKSRRIEDFFPALLRIATQGRLDPRLLNSFMLIYYGTPGHDRVARQDRAIDEVKHALARKDDWNWIDRLATYELLGSFYRERSSGSVIENLEAERRTCREALSYIDEHLAQREDAGQMGSGFHAQLAQTYVISAAKHVNEDQLGDIDRAIVGFTTALAAEHADEDEWKGEFWGQVQRELGEALGWRADLLQTKKVEAVRIGDAEQVSRLNEHIDEAFESQIRAFKAALTVFTRKEYGLERARIQALLAHAYARRTQGDIRTNMTCAIRRCKAALRYIEGEPEDQMRCVAVLSLMGQAYSTLASAQQNALLQYLFRPEPKGEDTEDTEVEAFLPTYGRVVDNFNKSIEAFERICITYLPLSSRPQSLTDDERAMCIQAHKELAYAYRMRALAQLLEGVLTGSFAATALSLKRSIHEYELLSGWLASANLPIEQAEVEERLAHAQLELASWVGSIKER